MHGNHTQTWPRSSPCREERKTRMSPETEKKRMVNRAQSWRRTTIETQTMTRTLTEMMKTKRWRLTGRASLSTCSVCLERTSVSDGWKHSTFIHSCFLSLWPSHFNLQSVNPTTVKSFEFKQNTFCSKHNIFHLFLLKYIVDIVFYFILLLPLYLLCFFSFVFLKKKIRSKCFYTSCMKPFPFLRGQRKGLLSVIVQSVLQTKHWWIQSLISNQSHSSDQVRSKGHRFDLKLWVTPANVLYFTQ